MNPMASASGRSPRKSKGGGEDRGWKSSLTGLLSNCGSGRSKQTKSRATALNVNAPFDPSEATWTRIDDSANVSREVVAVNATPGHGTDNEVEVSYTELREIGKGTFGIVYRARLCDTNELVAIKKTLDDPKFKNRELLMMRQLEHPNVLNLRYFYYSEGIGFKKGERYLHMVLDYIPETLFSVAKCDGTYSKPLLDPLYVKVYTYQVFRSLAYLHSLNISHRDVKPQNLLLNPDTHIIKLCDFGSAKELAKGDTNVAYICSRYYRAPELVLGATDYTCQIDVWSAGCVLAELFQGHPVFPGANGPDQMVEIIKILGTPSFDDLNSINPRFTQFRFPYLAPHPWEKVIKHLPPAEALDLISRVLVYSPSRRITPLEACAHPFYDELRRRGTRFRNGQRLPPLFNFKPEELEINPSLNSKLRPDYDEDDHDYVDSLAQLPMPNSESHLSDNHPSRLDSFRSSFKRTVPKIQAQLKRIGSKRGDKAEAKSSIETRHLEDETGFDDQETVNSEHDMHDNEISEDFEEELEDRVRKADAPDNESKPRKNKGKGKGKGKRSTDANDPDAGENSWDLMNSMTSSVNPSAFDETEVVSADVESLNAQAPKKKKKKKKKERIAREEDEDTTLDDAQLPQLASTPNGDEGEETRVSADSLISSPGQGAPETPSVEINSGTFDDSIRQESGVTKKTKKKTTKKTRTRHGSNNAVETTEVVETVVTTQEHSTKSSDI